MTQYTRRGAGPIRRTRLAAGALAVLAALGLAACSGGGSSEQAPAAGPVVAPAASEFWADPSTVDLLSALSRRRQPARLLLLATYRPVEVILGEHPLRGVKRELLARRLCHEFPLGPL